MTGIDKLPKPSACDDYCKGCGHYNESYGASCEYMRDTGMRRPCPAGTGCTEHTKHKNGESRRYVNPMAQNTKQARKPGHQPGTPAANRKIEEVAAKAPPDVDTYKIDADRARQLFEDGLDDAAMADALGVKEEHIKIWRRTAGLRRTPGRKKAKKETEPMKKFKTRDTEDAVIEQDDTTQELPAAAPTCCQPGKSVDVWADENAAAPSVSAPEPEPPITVSGFKATLAQFLSPALDEAELRIDGREIRGIFGYNVSMPGGFLVVDLITEEHKGTDAADRG